MSLVENVAEASAMYEDGATLAEVGKVFGATSNTVAKHLRRVGVFIRPKGNSNRTRPAPTEAELRYLVYEARKSYREIASTYGVAATAVGYWLDGYGIPRPGRCASRYRGADLPTPEQITALYETGLSLQAVADHFGVGIGYCAKRLQADARNSWPASYGRGHGHGKDGHAVRSSLELLVCNYLHTAGIPHVYEPRLPFSGHWRADFYASGHFIEIWGWAGTEYEERRVRKTAEYERYGVPVLHLVSTDFRGDWRAKLDGLQATHTE